MNYWLLKSEPNCYSFDDLLRDKKSMWDGVRNYQARNHLRAMHKGDLALFYHSNIGKEVVGVMQVLKEAYPDPTAKDGDWSVVEVTPVKKFKTPVSLEHIKHDPKLSEIKLIKQSRLSVMPLTKSEFDYIMKLGEL